MKNKTHSKRLFLFSSVSIATIVVFCAIIGVVNYLSYRHYIRKDLTQSKIYTISEKSEKILHSLSSPIDIFVFFPETSPIFSYIKFTTDEFSRLSNQLHVEYIDVDKDLLKAQEYKEKFKLSNEEYIVVAKDDRFRALVLNDLAEYDYENSLYGQEPVLKGYKGEQALINAILSVNEETRIKIYFTKGHGEKDLNDYKNETGYAEVANLLKRSNYLVETIALAEAESIPADTSLLIIAGPQKQFTTHEIQLISTYIKDGKPCLIFLDPSVSSGLEKIISQYGVVIGNDVVVDPSQHVPFSSPAYLLANIEGNHPITKPLAGMMGMFFLARSVSPSSSESENDTIVTSLVKTTAEGWGETDFTEEPPKKDPNADLAGPVSIAVAVERDHTNQGKKARFVVFGDSDFIGNTQIHNLANSDLFENSVSWLLQHEQSISISPKLFERKTVTISNRDMSKLTIIVIIIMPAISLLTGIAVWRIRRK